MGGGDLSGSHTGDDLVTLSLLQMAPCISWISSIAGKSPRRLIGDQTAYRDKGFGLPLLSHLINSISGTAHYGLAGHRIGPQVCVIGSVNHFSR